MGKTNKQKYVMTGYVFEDDETKQEYKRIDVTAPPPEEYRFTARMPGVLGLYLNEKAYQNRTTITAVLNKMIEEDMKNHPEIVEGLKKINSYL